MNKLTPLKKQAKRAQRAFYTKQRGSWNGLCPGHKADREWKDLLPSKEQTRTSP